MILALEKDGGPNNPMVLFEKPKPSFGIPSQLVFILRSLFSSCKMAIAYSPEGSEPKLPVAELPLMLSCNFLMALPSLSGNPSLVLKRLTSIRP